MEIQKSESRFAGVRFAGIRRTSRAALALLLLMGALSLLLQPARASVWQDGIWQGESVALTTDDGFIVSAQEDTADFSAEFKPAENQDGYVVLEIDVQGALQVMKSMPDCVSVFILPPSFEELEHRLRGRGTETEDRIEARLETAKRELPYAPQYDYQIVNGGDLEEAYQELRSVFLKSTGRA